MYIRHQPFVQKDPMTEDRTIDLTWPWWVHPGWALLLLTGAMAAVAAAVPPETYARAWGVRKFLDGNSGTMLGIAIAVCLIGIIFTSGMARRGGSTTVYLSAWQVQYLCRAYRTVFFLTLTGYVLFFGFAFVQGVGFGDLAAVLQRDDLAIYRVKAQIQTIPGLTTMTQFGPVAVVLGFILHRVGCGGRGFLLLIGLSCLRVIFYSERLALIEMLVPLILVAALTIDRQSKLIKWISLAPAIIAPLIWLVFAASEYFRSWVHYQHTTDVGFLDWVTLRLFGYYTTSFNNSALFFQAHEGTQALPFYSVGVFWNAPILSSIVSHPGIMGMDAEKWWSFTLSTYSSPEFNNEGSFLTAVAEFGPILGALFWLSVGLVLGSMFSALSKGSVPALIAYATLFIGILELARFIYWTEGRAFPVLLALIVISATYPKSRVKPALPSNRTRLTS